jgi:hypothetical protein
MKHFFKRDERGQSAVLFAFALPIFFGFLALAIDLGVVTFHMVKLQNSADLAVLSSVQSLPENVLQAESDARRIFKENYGSEAPIKNVILFNSGNGMKIIYKETVNLYFLPIIGKKNVKLNGKAEAIIEPLAYSGDIVPIGINFNTTFVPGVEVSLFGDLNNPSNGNFGLIDPTSDNSFKPEDFEYYIANDYKGEKGMPSFQETVKTKTGSLGQKIEDGFTARLEKGLNYIICPVVDFSSVNGKDDVTILGYARFEAISVNSLNGRHVTITGKFTQFINVNEKGHQDAGYYGVKTVRLIK